MDILSLVTSTTYTHQPYEMLLFLGLIIVISKLLSLGLGKLHMPNVISFLITGLVIGLIAFLPECWFKESFEVSTDALKYFAKVGVILIMFSAGLETDVSKIKAMGIKSVIITSLGVIVPLGLGVVLSLVYSSLTNAGMSIYTMLYYGVILSATSVSITVAVLKELKKIDTPVGTALISAAILDDIIGIILLSVVISMNGAGGESGTPTTIAGWISDGFHLSGAANIALVIVCMILFFAITIGLGILARKFFNYLGKKYPHHIRITILAFGICFIWSYVAELFSIADITGAYMVGLILSSTSVKQYVDHRSETISNNIFTPVFFAMIMVGLYSSFNNFDPSFLVFGLLWVFAGLIGKVLGAGAGALICKFDLKDSTAIGFGMMARAEVLIVCASKGIDAKLVDPQIMIYTVILILISSFITPILLKLIYHNDSHSDNTPKIEEKDSVKEVVSK